MEGNAQKNNEGFIENEEDHLNKHTDKDTDSMYFKIPEAKPLLSKHFIDYSQPKVLIKDIKIIKQPQELFTCYQRGGLVGESVGRREEVRAAESSLCRRFIDSNHYKIIYMKYYSGKIQDFERKTTKKLKAEINKISKNTDMLFSTFLIDMNFLFQIGSYILRNLEAKSLLADYQISQTIEKDVEFDSRIESGNLMYAFQRHDHSLRDYFLILENDINTKGYGNWFYFKVMVKTVGKIKLNLMNLQKNFSFFGHGMRVAMFSVRNYLQNGSGWSLGGENFMYHRNELLKDQLGKMRYNTLSFTLQNTYQNDLIFVAPQVPYTYSKLLHYLDQILKASKDHRFLYCRKETLASTISSNQCPLLTLTWKKDKNPRDLQTKKKIIVIMARQHPNEMVSSFVMEGLLNQLVNHTKEETKDLLRRYLFKIIPMVNVDGVIYGNSRCDISGSDINRKWYKTVNQYFYPVVSAIQKMITNLISEGYEIEYFIDLHGHTRKLGSFIYACKTLDDVETRMFSWIMSKICNQFSFESCKFGINNFRKDTARGYMLNFMPNKKSMTLQTSLYAYKHLNSIKPFSIPELQEIGKNLLQAIHIDTFRNTKLINWLTVRNDIRSYLLKCNKEQQFQFSQSDSNPQIDQLTPLQKINTFISPNNASRINPALSTLLKAQQPIQPKHRQDQTMQLRQELGREYESSELLIEGEENILSQRYLQSQMLSKGQRSKGNSQLKESKSVTKIIPFKLHGAKSSSVGKKIRIALQFERIQKKEQKLSTGSLPMILKKDGKSFWNNLKKQCQNLINQKKNLVTAYHQLHLQKASF